jgi:hypothetical protein
MPNAKFCPACGAPTNGAKFCPECGARTEAAPVSTPTEPTALTPAVTPEPPAPTAAASLFTAPATLPAPATRTIRASALPEEDAEPDADEVETETEPDAEPDSPEADDAALAEAPAAHGAVTAAARKPIKVSTRISYDVAAEPYEKGKCTVTLALTIRPDDGHPDGPQVVIGVRSHDESPLLSVKRLNALALPPELLELVHQYEATLAERGAAKAATQVKAEADKKAAEEKRKQAEAARKARTSSKTATAKRTATSKPAAPAKPEAPQPAPVTLATLF